jgi:replicative DNA helicase
MSFPFNTEFQRKIVKLALEDDGFCSQSLKHIEPQMFESDALQWAWRMIQRERQDQRSPTMMVLKDRLRDVQQVLRPRYSAMVQMLEADVMREEAFVRQRLSEFIQRNMFVAAFEDGKRLYNMERVDDAIDLMRRETQKAQQVTFDRPDRGWFFEELQDRQRLRRRIQEREWEYTFPTGIHITDLVLDGGLSRGELGTWIADSKGGKSLFLNHLALYTARGSHQPVLFCIFEGARLQTENRLDSLAAGILYSEVKRGDMDALLFERMMEEYRQLRSLLVTRGFTDRWTYTAADIRAELDDLRSMHGWRPVMIVCDYGDLLRSQEKVKSEEEHQRNAFSDLKALSTQDQGYAVWTASQARRPWDKAGKAGKDEEKRSRIWGRPVLRAKDIADSYNKIRRSDFIGSINQDPDEKKRNEARLYHELYRDAAAHKCCRIKQDLGRMVFANLLDPLNRPEAQTGDPDVDPEQEKET